MSYVLFTYPLEMLSTNRISRSSLIGDKPANFSFFSQITKIAKASDMTNLWRDSSLTFYQPLPSSSLSE